MNAVSRLAAQTAVSADFIDYTDEELFIEFRNFGARSCFDELVRRYQTGLTTFIYRLVGDRQTAEDACQAAFLRILQKGGLYDPARRFRPWLYRVARNAAFDVLRKSARRDATVSLDATSVRFESDDAASFADFIPSRDPDPTIRPENDETTRDLRNAVAQLPAQFRQILDLIFYQELKQSEVARRLSLTTSAVKTRLRRALRRLNELFESQRPDSLFERVEFERECPQT